MNKKIVAAIVLLLSVTGMVTVAAKNSNKIESSAGTNYPKIEVLQGVAFDKSNNQTKQVVFLVMSYGNEKNIYLIVGDEIYKMREAGNLTQKEEGTEVFFYQSEDGETLTILVQKFSWKKSAVGEFKNYLIAFSCCCKYGEQVVQANPGLGKVQKEIRKDVREQTRPVKGEWKGLIIRNREEVRNEEQKTLRINNISLEEILQKAKPINWCLS